MGKFSLEYNWMLRLAIQLNVEEVNESHMDMVADIATIVNGYIDFQTFYNLDESHVGGQKCIKCNITTDEYNGMDKIYEYIQSTQCKLLAYSIENITDTYYAIVGKSGIYTSACKFRFEEELSYDESKNIKSLRDAHNDVDKFTMILFAKDSEETDKYHFTSDESGVVATIKTKGLNIGNTEAYLITVHTENEDHAEYIHSAEWFDLEIYASREDARTALQNMVSGILKVENVIHIHRDKDSVTVTCKYTNVDITYIINIHERTIGKKFKERLF